MSALSDSAVLAIALASLAMCILLSIATFAARTLRNRQTQRTRELERRLAQLQPGQSFAARRQDRWRVLAGYLELRQSADPPAHTSQEVRTWLEAQHVDRRLFKRLRSRRRIRRIEAATCLGYLRGASVYAALMTALESERREPVRLQMAVAVHQVSPADSTDALLSTALRGSDWYLDRVKGLLFDSGHDFYVLARSLLTTTDRRLLLLLIDFAAIYPAADLQRFLERQVGCGDAHVEHKAAEAMCALYPKAMTDDIYVEHSNRLVRQVAFEALARLQSGDALSRMLAITESLALQAAHEEAGSDSALEYAAALVAVSNLLRTTPVLLPRVASAFAATSDVDVRAALAEIMSDRIQYYLMQLIGPQASQARQIVQQVVATGKTSEIIGFLNRNKSVELENEILATITSLLTDDALARDFQEQLAPRMLDKLGLNAHARVAPAPVVSRDAHKLTYLYALLVLAVLAYPALFLLSHRAELGSSSPSDLVYAYVTGWSGVLVVYSGTLQAATMVIIVFAVVGARAQARAWASKPRTMLFREGMLPAISIIAPAYNEQATIVESANSLLGIQYPDFELVIVNDGSTDATMDRLIEHFDLEKVDRIFQEHLHTMPIRGLYANPANPQILLVDKDNGGKADSLNAGINLSTKPYFCGIDADSLLESDSMLKVAAGCLDSNVELIASGGNVLPVNGCRVERGALVEVHLPRSPLALFQTIEYLRAFMAGRVGWSYIKSLLIISGAFGLFSRDRVIQVGGYLTRSGRYHQDTVGEDMELVVRLRRLMQDADVPHQISYAYNANCWTEVPESLSVLHRQRDRWQRGLVDIQYFHRRMLFNPKYRTVGLLGMPYYFVFEMLGPLIEVQAYAMVILAAVMGLLSPTMAVALFTTVVLWGLSVSLLSILIAEMQAPHFTSREVVTLLGSATIENFGFRQLASLWRVTGYLNSMRRPRGWGSMTRKGFATVE